MSSIPTGSRHADLDRDKRNAEASVSALEEHLGELEELLTQAPSQGTAKALRRTEQQLHTMRDALRDIEEQQAGVDGGLIHMRMSSLGDAMEPEEGEVSLPAINAGLRTLFSGVVVDHHSGHLAFHWKQGGVTEVIYQWPE